MIYVFLLVSVDPLLWVVVYVTCIIGNTGKLIAIKCLNYRGSKEESEEKYKPVATSKCNFFKTCNMNRLLNHSSCRGNWGSVTLSVFSKLFRSFWIMSFV